MGGGHISVDRGGEAGIDHAAVTKDGLNDLNQPGVDGKVGIDQTNQSVGTAGLDQGGAYISGSFGLVAALREVELDFLAALLDCNVNPDRAFEIDAVMVDERLRFCASVRPRADGLTYSIFGVLREKAYARQHGVLAIALDKLGQPTLAEAVGAYLAPYIAGHKLGRAAVGGDDLFNLFHRSESRDIAHGRQVQAFLIDFPR